MTACQKFWLIFAFGYIFLSIIFQGGKMGMDMWSALSTFNLTLKIKIEHTNQNFERKISHKRST